MEDSKALKPIRVKHTIGKDLAQLYSDGEICDCTLVVPKANREFKVSFGTKRKLFLRLLHFTGFTIPAIGPLARISSDVRR